MKLSIALAAQSLEPGADGPPVRRDTTRWSCCSNAVDSSGRCLACGDDEGDVRSELVQVGERTRPGTGALMQVGVNILNFGPGVGADALGRWARVAEDLGYHSIMISDHVAMTPDVRQRYPEPFYDPFATLAWIAGQTRRVQLGTTVCVLPYRHPILTARLAANIDSLSGGRFIFGVGVGNPNSKLEAEAMGVPFQRRGAMADEYLAAIKALWTQDSASFQGTFVRFSDVSRIRPASGAGRPHPPIWVGGASDAAVRRAVRFGDAWHPNR
ncbi:MAG: TIGR03619 family F420-dependent LLM class oxidoreductase, partial [Vicinamibacteria bacterium]